MNLKFTPLSPFMIVLALVGTLSSAVQGQDSDAQRLDDVEQELSQARDREIEKSREQTLLIEEISELQQSLIAAAKRIRDQEETRGRIQLEIEALMAEEMVIAGDLSAERSRLASFVGALQSLDRQRPPAILVHPDDAATAVRSAILLNTIIPQLNAGAKQIAGDLKNLRWVRQSIAQEKTRIERLEEALTNDRMRMEAMLSQKQQRQSDLDLSLQEERGLIATLAEEAQSLKALISGLDAIASRRLPIAKPDAVMAALNPGPAPQLFSQSKGSLQLPVSGRIVEDFGTSDELGQTNQGLRISSVNESQVVTPFDGTIVFAGPFLEHDQLLLIEAGEGYHILLSGMARIYGQVGDRLLAGEPVGIMGKSDGLRGSRLENNRNLLYLEFRKDGEPINPLPWLDEENRKVSG